MCQKPGGISPWAPAVVIDNKRFDYGSQTLTSLSLLISILYPGYYKTACVDTPDPKSESTRPGVVSPGASVSMSMGVVVSMRVSADSFLESLSMGVVVAFSFGAAVISVSVVAVSLWGATVVFTSAPTFSVWGVLVASDGGANRAASASASWAWLTPSVLEDDDLEHSRSSIGTSVPSPRSCCCSWFERTSAVSEYSAAWMGGACAWVVALTGG